MFEDLRDAFREAMQNFKEELNRDTVPGNVDRLLQGMVDEVTQARARLKGIQEELERTRKQVAVEVEQVETNQRRERLALDIDDGETAELAAEYTRRHEKRLAVFRKKEAALEEERALLATEVDEMMASLKEARERRAGLTAQAGRTGARETLGGADDLFDAMDRMEERISGHEHSADAARDFASEFDDLNVDPHSPPRRPEVDVDARLAELKRRMGKE